MPHTRLGRARERLSRAGWPTHPLEIQWTNHPLVLALSTILLACGNELDSTAEGTASDTGAGTSTGTGGGGGSSSTATTSTSAGSGGTTGQGGGGAGGDGPTAFSCNVSDMVFCDDFETGDLSHTDGDARWGNAVRVTVVNDRALSGTQAAQFRYEGNASLAANADAFAELRFDLGAAHPELWTSFELFIPDNYVHRDADSSDNNKLFRLWGDVYGDKEKVGFSMWPTDGLSGTRGDWNVLTGTGPKGEGYSDFVAAEDLGKWMSLVIHTRAATPSTLGTLELWKNGELIISNVDALDNYTDGETLAYQRGYLLGWSNSGFTEDTFLYIDNVLVRTVAP